MANEGKHSLDFPVVLASRAGDDRERALAAEGFHAVNFCPDDSAFGLWSFPSGRGTGSPWSSLVPVAPSGSTTNGVSQLQRLITAAAKSQSLVGGETALHDITLSRLRSLVDAARPVPIITIGIGDGADIPALRQISAVTGGKTYAVKNPAQVRDVFLDAMVQRQCRPNC